MKNTTAFHSNTAISYAEYGDPNGFPILVQHGLIASIQGGFLFRRLTDAGARVICAARPGYGESTPYLLRNVGEWGNLVCSLVDALGLNRFDVLGISSGAPYSYAIARALPERVRDVFILSGTPALYDEQIRACWPYPITLNASISEMQVLAYDLFFSGLSEEEREADDIRDSMRNDCFGPALDLAIRCRDWDFRLEDVKTPVYMRHSLKDGSVPYGTAARTADLLPNCQLETRKDDPHFSQEVLDSFINDVILKIS